MSVSTRRPELTDAVLRDWRLMRDAYVGERAIKFRKTDYLPKPSGFTAMPDKGEGMYDAYLSRARFPEILSTTIRGMLGVIHGQEWDFELPPALEGMYENCTPEGLPLDNFAQRITRELLITGRYAVMADAPAEGGDPYLLGYQAEQLINWDEYETFYVFEEIDYIRDGFIWTQITRNRVLELDENGRYVQSVYIDGSEDMAETAEVEARGARALDYVPVSVGGAMDMDLKPDTPPLIGVARAALAHYQLNADYRLQLFMSGQETMVIYNATELPKILGAGVIVGLQSADETKDVRAEYVGPTGSGIEAHERAMDREQNIAMKSGAQLLDQTSRSAESGDARRLRFAAETATLQSIAIASAAILEKALRFAADMAGANPDDVSVRPPKNLLEGRMDAGQLTALVAAWEKGAFGYETLYDNLVRGHIANPDRTAEDEQSTTSQGFLPIDGQL